MTDAENLLSPLLDTIAKEQGYNNYKKELKLFYSGGANYTSQLYNITLSAPGKDDLKLFAKVAAIGEQLRSLTTMQVFETEITFYTTILALYREYEEKYNFPEDSRMILPKYYGGSTEYMKETLILEELTSKGYEAFDRFKCYDWEYASKCISTLARLHALSIRFEKDSPKKFADLVEKFKFQFPMEEMKGMIEKTIENALEATADEHKEKLGKFIKEYLTEEKMLAFYDPKRKVVLNHGDIRPSNVMHKRDENGDLKVIVIDYQVLQKGNPLIDLIYFFISGSDEEFRKKHWTQYFEYYYEEFSKTLRWLEINPDEVYSKADYDADLKEMLPYGITVGMFTLPFITVDVENAPKLEDGIDFESFAMDVSSLFKTRFNGLVSDYVKRGLL